MPGMDFVQEKEDVAIKTGSCSLESAAVGGWMRIHRVQSITAKGDAVSGGGNQHSNERPNESAGEEVIDLNKASPGAGGYKALGTNARRKKQAGSV